MPNQTEEIKARVDIVDLLSEYLKLQRAGSNFRALCPFHNEKTPSFMVSAEKQIWHCFGCSKGGDIFTFIQDHEGVEFPEALRILAKRAGVKLTFENPELHNRKTRLLDLARETAFYWQEILSKADEAEFVRQYLKSRHVQQATIEEFQLGYARESWDDTLKFLQSKGYSLKEISEAGLSVTSDKGKPYDRFRNRLIFPIRDVHGAVVGFTARKMSEEDKGGKYINSPQTGIYNKSQILYNLDLAKKDIKRLGYAILVEGNMDAVSSWQAGIKNVIAVSGTALTDLQISLLKRYTQNVMIAFDADVAGVQANLRGIDLLWQSGFNVKVIRLPKDLDPDDLIRQNPDKWKAVVKEASGYMDYVFDIILLGLDLKRVDHKKTAAKKILPIIAKLGDEVEKDHYLAILADKLGVSQTALKESLSKVKVEKKLSAKEEIRPPAVKIDQQQRVAESLLSLLINFPEKIHEISQSLKPEIIGHGPAVELYKDLIFNYNKKQSLNLAEISPEKLNYINRLSLFIDKGAFQGSPGLVDHEISELADRLKYIYLKKQLAEVQRLLTVAEKKQDQEEIKKLTSEFSSLASQLKEIDF